jgi:hypothetical protein
MASSPAGNFLSWGWGEERSRAELRVGNFAAFTGVSMRLATGR